MQTIDIFPWNEHFNTGVKIIDVQHRKLVDILNRLASQLAQNKNEFYLNEILEELSDYTVYHFETEEKYWCEYIQDEKTESDHQKVHASFIKKIVALKEEQKTKPFINVIEEALGFLTNWLASHILETDREMAYIATSIRKGETLQAAKAIAKTKMNDSSHIFIQIILSIYQTLSQNTLKLIKEIKLHQNYDQTLLYEHAYRQLLLELSTSFINTSLEENEDELIVHALEKMTLFLKLDRAYIFEYNLQKYTVSNTYEWCSNGVTPQINNLQNITIDKIIECFESHKLRENVTIKDVSLLDDSLLRASLLEQDVKSLINVPLIYQGECYGFVGFDSVKELHIFSDVELTLLKLFAELLENVRHKKESDKSLRLAASAFIHSREGILITNNENKIIDANQAVTEITGYSKEELLGQNPKILSSGKNSPKFYKKMWQALRENDIWTGEIWNRRKNGEFYAEMLTLSAVRDKQNKIINYLALFADITSLKDNKERLEYLTHYDSLTGLPNRILLSDRLAFAIAQTQRRKTSVAVVYLDLDGFKEINDTYGHNYGDTLLSIVAKKIQKILRSDDTVARMGGDEFAIVLSRLHSNEESIPLLERLLKSVSEIDKINDKEIKISASLGISFFNSGDQTDPDQLLRQADQAMYQAKLAGKNRYHIFDIVEDKNIRSHHQKIDAVEKALQNNEFILYYQPKVNMKSGLVLGFEALIRWNHPKKGTLSPYHFLPTIEEHPMSIRVGEWVIEEACKQILLFKEQNLHFTISVNINAIHLLKGNFVQNITEILKKYPQIEAGDLMIEILETSTLEDLGQVSHIIKETKKLGVNFSLDDFGTGYSSLTYLKKLAVEQIKIDQSFIRDMLGDADDLAIIEGIITLSNSFHREIVAEGVESVEHGEILLQLGCEIAQGYIIARPMPSADILKWLHQYKPNPIWQKTKRIEREKITYLHAIAEHIAWLKNIFYTYENNLAHNAQFDPIKCCVGIWLQEHSCEKELLKNLIDLHNEIHSIATRLLNTSDATQESKKLQALLLESSKKFVLELKEMISS